MKRFVNGVFIGQGYANSIKQRAPRRGDKWHLDEMCIVMNKRKYWLWRAVDQDGYELDIVLQSRRLIRHIVSSFYLYMGKSIIFSAPGGIRILPTVEDLFFSKPSEPGTILLWRRIVPKT
jgi:hypothetical protein